MGSRPSSLPTGSERYRELCLPPSAFLWFQQSSSPTQSLQKAVSSWTRLVGTGIVFSLSLRSPNVCPRGVARQTTRPCPSAHVSDRSRVPNHTFITRTFQRGRVVTGTTSFKPTFTSVPPAWRTDGTGLSRLSHPSIRPSEMPPLGILVHG